MGYTVCGVDKVTCERVELTIYADNVERAEDHAFWKNPNLLIAGVFNGHPARADRRQDARPCVMSEV